jgi:PadR family transcriptional regulator PadR
MLAAMPRGLLGEVEHFVLLALLRLDGPQYGVPVLEEIAARTGHKPSRAAIYIALQRLEAKGFVKSWLGEPTPERGGRARRYYELTRAGVAVLRDARQAQLRMWANVEHRLEPER